MILVLGDEEFPLDVQFGTLIADTPELAKQQHNLILDYDAQTWTGGGGACVYFRVRKREENE